MYDFISETALTWPSLSIEWHPLQQELEGFIEDKVLLTTFTSREDVDYLKIAKTQLPLSLVGKNGDVKVNSRLKVFCKIETDIEVNRARFMPQNPNLAGAISADGSVSVYNLESESLEKKCLHHKENGYGITWNRFSEGVMATGADDKTVALWDINNKGSELSPTTVYKQHTSIVNDVSFHEFSPSLLGSVGDDGYFYGNDTRDDQKSICAKLCDSPLNSLAFSKFSENIFAVSGQDSNVYLYDLRDYSKPLHVMMGHTKPVTCLKWSPHHENIVASGSEDRRVIMWDINKFGMEQLQDEMEDGVPELLMMHGGHTSCVNDLSFHPQIPWFVASCSDDNIAHLWKVSDKILVDSDESVADDLLE